MNEIETKEINGTKFLLYPTLELRADVLEIFKDAQIESEITNSDGSKLKKKGNFDIKKVIKVCSDIVYEACWNHDEKGNRKDKKSDESSTTYEDIKSEVINSGVFELYLEIAGAINIIDKTKKDEIDTQLKEVKPNPQ